MSKRTLWLIGLLVAAAGTTVWVRTMHTQKPDKAQPVANFDLQQYLGKWYEIARIDFRFERDMDHTTAEYSLRDDGKIKVFNRGYDTVSRKFKSATGKAKFRGSDTIAELRVSFFGPFYSGYNVIAIDPNYQYALVAGESLDYLWILSRRPQIPDSVRESYLQVARSAGYDTSKLVWVNQD